MLLQCPETNRWGYQFLNAEWLKINEEVAYKKIIGCKLIMLQIKGLWNVFV
jgi:hypothetical protein